MPSTLSYPKYMDDPQNAVFYKRLIDQAGSYHDLAVFRSRYFSLMERTLSKQDCLEVKDHWNAKAKDDTLPVAPASTT